MKIFIILALISTVNFAQLDSIKKILGVDEIIELYPEKPVQLVGGIDSLQSRLQYPNLALEKGIEGTVYIELTVDTLGRPSNPRILNFKRLGFGCDEEAIRLVTTSNYLPAILQGKKIKSQFMIPIKFKLPIE